MSSDEEFRGLDQPDLLEMEIDFDPEDSDNEFEIEKEIPPVPPSSPELSQEMRHHRRIGAMYRPEEQRAIYAYANRYLRRGAWSPVDYPFIPILQPKSPPPEQPLRVQEIPTWNQQSFDLRAFLGMIGDNIQFLGERRLSTYVMPRPLAEMREIKWPIDRDAPINSYREYLDEKYVKSFYTIRLAIQRLQSENYHVVSFLDNGRTSNVYLVKDNVDGQIRSNVAKIVDFSYMPLDLQQQIKLEELNVLRIGQNHSNIVQLRRMILDENERFLIILMEYGPHTLQTWISDEDFFWNMDLATMWSLELNKGLSFLHENGYAHRDLRASDLLLWCNGRLKICDFTHAKYLKNTRGNVIRIERCTDDLQYLAPEYYFYKSIKANPFVADCFAYGVLVYIMFMKKHPFGLSYPMTNAAEQNIYDRIKFRQFSFPYDLGIRANYKLFKMFKGLLCVYPERRWSLDRAYRCRFYEHNNMVPDSESDPPTEYDEENPYENYQDWENEELWEEWDVDEDEEIDEDNDDNDNDNLNEIFANYREKMQGQAMAQPARPPRPQLDPLEEDESVYEDYDEGPEELMVDYERLRRLYPNMRFDDLPDAENNQQYYEDFYQRRSRSPSESPPPSPSQRRERR